MKKLAVIFLGIFLVVSLVGCGGGGGSKKKDKKGVAMDQATLTKHYEEVLDVDEGMEKAGIILVVAMDEYMTAESQVKSMGEGDGEEDDDDKALEWSTTPDQDGWYTAVDSWSSLDGNHSYTYTFKIRLLSTGVIEYSERYESKDNDDIDIYTDFMSISKGSDGLWNGNKTGEESGSESRSQKTTFNNLNTTYGSGKFTLLIKETEGTLSGEFTISWDGTKFIITGTFTSNNKTIKINKTLTPEEIAAYEGGDEGGSGEG